MTVKELIALLQQVPNQDANIVLDDSELDDTGLATVYRTQNSDWVHLSAFRAPDDAEWSYSWYDSMI